MQVIKGSRRYGKIVPLARRTRPYNRVKELHIPAHEGATQKDVSTLRTESGYPELARPQSQNKAAESKARKLGIKMGGAAPGIIVPTRAERDPREEGA